MLLEVTRIKDFPEVTIQVPMIDRAIWMTSLYSLIQSLWLHNNLIIFLVVQTVLSLYTARNSIQMLHFSLKSCNSSVYKESWKIKIKENS